MESYISKRSHPLSQPLSLEGMRLTAENLKGAYDSGDDIKYRERMAWANTIAGIAINLAGNCGIHALGHPLAPTTTLLMAKPLPQFLWLL